MKSTEQKKKTSPVFIVPTRYGFLYASLVFVFLIAGTVYINNSLLIASGILVSLGLVCMHQTHFNVARVTIEDLDLQSGFSSGKANWKIRLRNNSNIPSFSINLRDVVIDVPGSGVTIENISVTLRKRGRVRLKELKISTTYPFGLFYAWKWWNGDSTFYVYPALKAEVRLPAQKPSEFYRLDGHEDFLGHKHYSTSDSAHHIDWRLFARSTKLMIKQFDTDSLDAVFLNYDDLVGMEREERLSVLATAVHELYRIQRPFGLRLGQTDFAPSYDIQHYQKCLIALSIYENKDEQEAA